MTYLKNIDIISGNEIAAAEYNEPLIHALSYALLGMRVLPIKSPDKMPFDPDTDNRMANWPARATTEREQIIRWWGGNPDLGVCIATGRDSNLVVIDIDQKEGKNGETGLRELCSLLGALPKTVEARTPSGGRHLFFAYPTSCNTRIGNPTNFGRRALGIDTHVDVRADGGQVNVAPTQRPEGRYEWLISPDATGLAELPETWVGALMNDWPASGGSPSYRAPEHTGVREGSRNDTLFREASRLRGLGLDESAILALLSDMNVSHCTPPLDASEVQSIARSAMRYPANERFPVNDAENAELFVRMHGGTTKYLHDTNRWLVRDGHIWRLSTDKREERLAMEVVENLKQTAEAIPDKDARKVAANWARRSGDQARVRSLIQAAQRSTEIAAQSSEFDGELHYVPVSNGFVDLRTGELVAEIPQGQFTKVVPVRFDPAATAPGWDRFLSRILDADVAEFLQTFVGSCLHGVAPTTQRLLLLQGLGANGKSVLIDTLWELLAPFCQRLDPESLATRKVAKDARSDLTKLAGARLVVASEFPARRQLDTSLLKQMTGDAKLVARDLYKSETAISIGWGLFIVSNPLPLAPEWDYAFWRRAVRVHFDRTIPEQERDSGLQKHLVATEGAGILNWVVQGAVRFHKQGGLIVPRKCEIDTARWREEKGTIARFVSMRCTVGAEERIPFRDFFRSYSQAAYSMSGGAHPYDESQVNQWLESSGYTIQRDATGEWVVGLSIARPQ